MKFSKLFKVINNNKGVSLNNYKEQIKMIINRYNNIYDNKINSYVIYDDNITLSCLTEDKLTTETILNIYKIVNCLNKTTQTELKLVQA